MFLIKTGAGYVAGFDEEHDIVQVTPRPDDNAQRFANQLEAQAFIDSFANCGYGFTSEDAEIVRL